MSQDILETIGLTKDELADRIVDRAVEQILERKLVDEDGYDDFESTPFAKSLQKRVTAKIDEAVESIAGRHVLPNVESYVENLCLQETNRWGEKTGKQMTFIEYLVDRAEKYMLEEVNHNGEGKGRDSYGWKSRQTRIAHMVHKHLQFSIETAMKDALAQANGVIVKGLEETVKMKLQEIHDGLKVAVQVKR